MHSLWDEGQLGQHVRLGQKRFDESEKLSRVGYAFLNAIQFWLKEHIIISEDPVVLLVGQNFRQR